MRDDVLARLREDEARLKAQIAEDKWNVSDVKDGMPNDATKAAHKTKLQEQLASIRRQIAELEAEGR